MAWYEGIVDAAQNYATSAISGIDWESVAKDALGGAVIAEISGGDVWKAAAYSGFGSMVGSSDFGKELFGDFSTEFGGAISGYGIADASGESGLLGGLAGAGYKYMNKDLKTGGVTDKKGKVRAERGMADKKYTDSYASAGMALKDAAELDAIADGSIGGESLSWLKENGLIDKDGKPTLLADMGVNAIAGLYAHQRAQDLQKRAYKVETFKTQQLKERERNADELAFKDQQRQTAGFARYGRK